MAGTAGITCRHLGELTGTQETDFGLESVYQCGHPGHGDVRIVDCIVCPDFFLLKKPGDMDDVGCRHPAGVVIDRYDRPCSVADLYKGAQAFLFLGGPSVKTLPLELLGRRGVLLMSVNNCPASLPEGVRPQVWLHTDPTGKFSDSIWRDPGILKFTPDRHWRSRWADDEKNKTKGIRRLCGGKVVGVPELRACDMPGVLGFHRNHNFDPENWLWEPRINNGNDEEHATGKKRGKKVREPNGWPKTINTMLAGVRLAFYLGVKTLYLVGADFRMSEGQEYSFRQGKSKGGVRSNNSAYTDMCEMFDGLVPHFQAAGFEVCNTNQESCLWSFPFLSFEEAIERATGSFQQTLITEGYYGD